MRWRPLPPEATTKGSRDQLQRASIKRLACVASAAALLSFSKDLYVVTPYPNVVDALDLSTPRANVKWKFEPAPAAASQGVACCDVVNRGGKFGVRGWLAALDTATGKLAWKAFSTGPDLDVLIGDQFKPFYAADRGTDLGSSTTKGTTGIFARDPATGSARWFYQMTPRDLHDYDGVNENILVDLPIGGASRKAPVHPDRNGYVYVMESVMWTSAKPPFTGISSWVPGFPFTS